MRQPAEMNTLSQILEKLRQKGYDNELTMTEDGHMKGNKIDKTYSPEDLTIIKTYRFEGHSDPGDNAVIYILKDNEDNISFISDAYGMYSEQKGAGFDEFLKKLPTADRDMQELF